MRIVEDFACTLCSCVCDDLRIWIDGDRIVRADQACARAEPWLLEQDAHDLPPARLDGRAVPFEVAVARAADLLADARWPLIFGLSRSSTEGQRAAVRLADTIGATIDSDASCEHAATILALQQAGESTCSLGEVRNRCDLVIFWGSNPVESHPRHLERYAADCAGLFTPRGRRDRKIVVVDVESTATSAVADLVVPVERGRDLELVWALRSMIRAKPNDTRHGVESLRDEARELCRLATTCRSGVVFFGGGLAHGSCGHLAVEALMRLVIELNAHRRFYACPLGDAANATGAENVLAWQTGYPFSVNLSLGYPRYNPGEFSANGMLERGEPDVCLLVGSTGAHRLSAKAGEHLRRIPTITLDAATTEPAIDGAVRFTTSVDGIHRAGTAYRMDSIPIPLRSALAPRHASDADVLSAIEAKCLRPAPRT